MHFFPFNPVDKRTALTYVDEDGNWNRVSKGAPEQVLLCHLNLLRAEFMNGLLTLCGQPMQIMNLCNCKEDIRKRVHTVIDKFAERGLRSLGVARQVCDFSCYDRILLVPCINYHAYVAGSS